MDISELLDKAKNRANLPSDYALAKVLGLSAGNLSNIRKSKAHPSNEVAVKLATLAGLDEMQVIAEIELRTANTPKKQEFWKNYLENRGIAACITMTGLALTIAITPDTSQAEPILHLQNYGAEKQEFSHPENDRTIHYAQNMTRTN